MHRITKNKTKSLQIAVVAVFMAMAAFAAKPAQAKFGLVGGYKYVAVQHNLNYKAHVGQMDFLWSKGGGGQGYRDGGKRPHQAFGFGLAVGGNRVTVSTTTTGLLSEGAGVSPIIEGNTSIYFAIPLIYEYVFPFGLGISGGVTIPLMVTIGGDGAGAGVGFGVSDFGLSYHFNNGLTFYSRVNLGYAAFFGGSVSTSNANSEVPGVEVPGVDVDIGSQNGIMWGVGGGLGYWF